MMLHEARILTEPNLHRRPGCPRDGLVLREDRVLHELWRGDESGLQVHVNVVNARN